MKKFLSLLLLTGLLSIQSNTLSYKAIECGDKPVDCSECLDLCTNCDQPNEFTCDEPSADANVKHPCHYYCI